MKTLILLLVLALLPAAALADDLSRLVIKPNLAPEPISPIARRALDLARREVAALSKSLHPWDKDARARIFSAGGHTEHHVRPQTQTMIAYAVVARFSPLEPERRAALADLNAMLRFVAPTHSIGPVLCSDGKKWQDQWQSALWAFQAGAAAWIVWDQIDEDLRPLIANMVAHEADRFIDKAPPHQVKNDTKAEENAWDSMPISLAANMMPTHPHARAWRETAIRWQLSSFVTPADTESDKIVDGKPLKDYKFGPNIHPDFTLENHDRVHPSYMGTIGINLDQHLVYKWGANPAPQALDHNAQAIYAVLKKFSHPDGRMHFPNGQDWELHRLTMGLHAIMSTLFKDSEAAYLENASYETLRRMAARTPDGPTCLKDEYFFPSYPGMVANDYAISFLFHLEFGQGADPVDRRTFFEKQSGVWNFEEGKFILARDQGGFISFSWGSRIMGQAIPFTMDLMGSPYELGFVGTVAAQGIKTRTAFPVLKDVRVTRQADGFTVVAALDRAGGAIEQQVAFIARPGKAIYFEQLKAQRDVTPSTIQTGTIGVLNEPEWVWQNAPRTLSWAGESIQVDGRQPHERLAIRSPWLLIDKAWAFAPLGAGEFIYDPNSKPSRGRREQLLWLAPPELHAFKAGEIIARRALRVDLAPGGLKAPAAASGAIEGNTVKLEGIEVRFGAGLPEVVR